jgi:hypothetical protein
VLRLLSGQKITLHDVENYADRISREELIARREFEAAKKRLAAISGAAAGRAIRKT